MVTIKQKFIPAGTKARSGWALKPEFITIHNTANVSKGANAASHATYMSNGGKNTYVSYHYVVDDKEAYQLLPDNEVAWHAGDGTNGPGNRKSLAIEICENPDGDLLKATDNAVELTAYLMKKHNIPLSNVVQHNKWSGKNCPNRIRAGQPYNWQTFLNKVQAAYAPAAAENTNGYTKIMGTPKATAAQMQAYIKSKNPSVPQSVIDMIPYYLSEGNAEGVRGDIAFAQSCLETGNFTFKGSMVTIAHNNFCGLGATSGGNNVASFASAQLGIRAQIQHLKAYACADALKNDCIDPRFKYVSRGAAPYVEYLGIQENPKKIGWAAGANYGAKILAILKDVCATVAINSATTSNLYRVRKSWDDAKSQIGAFASLDGAKAACKDGYYVYDANGNVVYPLATSGFSVGDEVQLVSGATYTNGKAIPNWVVKSKLYVREIRSNGDIVFSTTKIGLITGVAEAKYFNKYGAAASSFSSYKVKIDTDALNVRKGPGVNYDVVTVVKKGEVYTIVNESNGWGFLKSGLGYINLSYTKKV